jgi:hypothetical protein
MGRVFPLHSAQALEMLLMYNEILQYKKQYLLIFAEFVSHESLGAQYCL